MTTLKTPKEVVVQMKSYHLLNSPHPNQDDEEIATNIIKNDRQHTAQVLCDLINQLFEEVEEREDRVERDDVLKVIRQTLDPISSNER